MNTFGSFLEDTKEESSSTEAESPPIQTLPLYDSAEIHVILVPGM
jgi:hypothetical protein